ncbi:Glycosyltransferase involved in cell wall bisynthesis [Mucilaginibacter lappiensis]|uniref:Glycosyltransferase involved in cell wall biosynthesis n=1 Tax=Mucilaginibacter lappiensis TaxID=354630 RepID=A0ABR6PIQ4_9SPHI|nr:glycosyltransferase family 4 protein [Mucilaginibacter lappiensis]MBB6109521.1 glycosyltransferase involved in cell wall biosynthesis [Mucilaginibacter lappiensis]SIQ91997.1 Glycosyltransferase involved in cell wall bisynthesis [Mucilaginibacter lappiensis]
MIKVAFITRSTIYTVPGGDTIQAVQTARHLTEMGITADIRLANESILYSHYDLLHFFNLTRPADILYHSQKAGKPYVVSTILCNYGEYDKYHRKGAGRLLRYLSTDTIEYLKSIARYLLGRDSLASLSYTWLGQRKSIKNILSRAAMILPNSESEYNRVIQSYERKVKHLVVPNGADQNLFQYDPAIKKDEKLVICAARIEGIKNQLNLIRALNNTSYRLLLIGTHAPNQLDYYQECREIAAENVGFIDHIPQHELVKYYRRAKVHILPSWFETTGLSSIEAALMGCNIVTSDKGDVREYFADDAFYCDPSSPESILAAVEKASITPYNETLRHRILKQYTWKQAASQTLKAYQSVL